MPLDTHPLSAIRILLLAPALAAVVAAQCTNVWLPGDWIAGADRDVYASTRWDPDGYHQMIPLELDGLGNIVAITATNSLRVVAGTF